MRGTSNRPPVRRHALAAAAIVLAVLASLAAGCGQRPATGSGTAPSTSSPSATSTTPTLACGAPSADRLLDDYVGLTEDEAVARATADGLTLRVVGRDGECFGLTADYREDRVNVYLEGGVVSWAAVF